MIFKSIWRDFMKLLSVIVPVYNVENYIEECVNSICNQTYSNMEIILVDDGSIDKSSEICDALAGRDSRIVIIHQKNSGVSHARNVALDNCHGDYITLVDSDDYVLPNAFSVCIENIEKYNLDGFHIGHFRKGNGNGGSRTVKLSLEDEYEKRLRSCINNEETFSWGWVVKKEIWHDLRYIEGRVFEDGMIAPYIMERLHKVGCIDWELYCYRKESSGICQSAAFNPKARFDHILACEIRLKYAENKKYNLEISRACLLRSCMKYLTAYYARGDEAGRLQRCLELINETIVLEYDKNELGAKYRILLWASQHCRMINKIYAFVSKKYHK